MHAATSSAPGRPVGSFHDRSAVVTLSAFCDMIDGGEKGDNAGGTAVTIDVRAKRVYDGAAAGDGYRVLIDHVWPRGVSHGRAHLDEWARDLAPSDELRKWFDHVPERFPGFRARYRKELGARRERVEALRRRARDGTVTIVYAARDTDHNNAVVLAELIRDG